MFFTDFLVNHSCTDSDTVPDNQSSLVPAYPVDLQEDCGASNVVGYNSFKIVIDNIDMSVKSRFMRIDAYRNRSLHYVNSYAVQGRINFCELPDTHPHTCSNSPNKNALLLLPSVDDDKARRRVFITHIARVLITNMKYFKFSFDGIVEWHIKHSYYKEMSAKSTVVSNITACVLLFSDNYFCRYHWVFY